MATKIEKHIVFTHGWPTKWKNSKKLPLQKRIAPRFRNLKSEIWWPAKIRTNSCHLLCRWQREWTHLAVFCSTIWRNPKTWCFHHSASQLPLPCSPLLPKEKLSNKWKSFLRLGITLSKKPWLPRRIHTRDISVSKKSFSDNRITLIALSFDGHHDRIQVNITNSKAKHICVSLYHI